MRHKLGRPSSQRTQNQFKSPKTGRLQTDKAGPKDGKKHRENGQQTAAAEEHNSSFCNGHDYKMPGSKNK